MDVHRDGGFQSLSTRWLMPLLAIATALVIGGVLAACGGDDDDDDGEPTVEAATGWLYPNADLRNTRWVMGDIDSSNVDELAEAWTVPITAAGIFGGYSATPVVVDGVAYTQDLESNVTAIDFESGEVLWERKYDSPNTGPNGVNVVDGTVYGATQTDAFALSAETGEELWSKKLTRNENEGIDMAPGYNNGTVYVSTVPGNPEGFYVGDGQAILHAMDPETGETKWTWDEVPPDIWSKKHTDINSGGGQWHPPAFDEEGDVYVAVSNPGPWPGGVKGKKEFPWGSSRPGPNLYSNSCVKLDGETGELEWYYQAVPHDIYDWDMQIGPILTDVEVDGAPVVLCAGKMGYVYGINQDTGELVWKTSVGKHNGHDEDNLLALEEDYDQLPEPPYQIWPGILGGVETQMAIKDGTVFAAVNNLPSTVSSPTLIEFDPEAVTEGTGNMVALDIATGEIKWDVELPASPYGAASVVNDLVFTTTFDGKVYAFNTETGEIEWEQQLPAGTNAPVTIHGDTIITAGSFPSGKGQEAQIIAYRLGAEGTATTDETTTEATTTEETTTEETTTEETTTEEAAADGEQLFSQHCASCHTLAAANASGTIGPNLDDLQLPEDAVAEQVTNGGGGMPAFGQSLSDDEIQAVSQYVADNAGQGGGGEGGGGGGGQSGIP